jgi:hypothetical protein
MQVANSIAINRRGTAIPLRHFSLEAAPKDRSA